MDLLLKNEFISVFERLYGAPISPDIDYQDHYNQLENLCFNPQTISVIIELILDNNQHRHLLAIMNFLKLLFKRRLTDFTQEQVSVLIRAFLDILGTHRLENDPNLILFTEMRLAEIIFWTGQSTEVLHCILETMDVSATMRFLTYMYNIISTKPHELTTQNPMVHELEVEIDAISQIILFNNPISNDWFLLLLGYISNAASFESISGIVGIFEEIINGNTERGSFNSMGLIMHLITVYEQVLAVDPTSIVMHERLFEFAPSFARFLAYSYQPSETTDAILLFWSAVFSTESNFFAQPEYHAQIDDLARAFFETVEYLNPAESLWAHLLVSIAKFCEAFPENAFCEFKYNLITLCISLVNGGQPIDMAIDFFSKMDSLKSNIVSNVLKDETTVSPGSYAAICSVNPPNEFLMRYADILSEYTEYHVAFLYFILKFGHKLEAYLEVFLKVIGSLYSEYQTKACSCLFQLSKYFRAKLYEKSPYIIMSFYKLLDLPIQEFHLYLIPAIMHIHPQSTEISSLITRALQSYHYNDSYQFQSVLFLLYKAATLSPEDSGLLSYFVKELCENKELFTGPQEVQLTIKKIILYSHQLFDLDFVASWVDWALETNNICGHIELVPFLVPDHIPTHWYDFICSYSWLDNPDVSKSFVIAASSCYSKMYADKYFPIDILLLLLESTNEHLLNHAVSLFSDIVNRYDLSMSHMETISRKLLKGISSTYQYLLAQSSMSVLTGIAHKWTHKEELYNIIISELQCDGELQASFAQQILNGTTQRGLLCNRIMEACRPSSMSVQMF